ncbi:hypothetical protein Hypma_009812 [Hypsizygus marmoreus]|uniref:Uncharacterized protein n=1 Tax=Hypsizygus marmoreus TaxID=39966 RepID=A0A369JT86_HYPMA|nr:hypothetical protein Hypma_009812 [Hypsizygus marmoreus]
MSNQPSNQLSNPPPSNSSTYTEHVSSTFGAIFEHFKPSYRKRGSGTKKRRGSTQPVACARSAQTNNEIAATTTRSPNLKAPSNGVGSKTGLAFFGGTRRPQHYDQHSGSGGSTSHDHQASAAHLPVEVPLPRGKSSSSTTLSSHTIPLSTAKNPVSLSTQNTSREPPLDVEDDAVEQAHKAHVQTQARRQAVEARMHQQMQDAENIQMEYLEMQQEFFRVTHEEEAAEDAMRKALLDAGLDVPSVEEDNEIYRGDDFSAIFYQAGMSLSMSSILSLSQPPPQH